MVSGATANYKRLLVFDFIKREKDVKEKEERKSREGKISIKLFWLVNELTPGVTTKVLLV